MFQKVANPTITALSILTEYQKNIKSVLDAAGYSEVLQGEILNDLYITDNVYISLNQPYEQDIDTFDSFCRQHNLHPALFQAGIFPGFENKNLYVHQVRAIESILEGKTTIISTGTGSGKTEAFLIPLLDYCLQNKGKQGIKAVILYPINALASDQLERINKAVEGQGVTVKSFVGSTPREERNAMIHNPPDILITNYVMLDRLITKKETRLLFNADVSEQTLRYLVVDEIHYYRGTKGANLCLLLRRFRAFCDPQHQLIQIGASATLRQGGGTYRDSDRDQLRSYAGSLFGEQAAEHFAFITPLYDDAEDTSSTDQLPDTDQIITASLKAEANPSSVRTLAEQLAGRQLTRPRPGRGLDPLYTFVQRNPFVRRTRARLKQHACTLAELIELFSSTYREYHQREPRQPAEMVQAYFSVIDYLNSIHSGKASSVPEPALDYRLHLILSNLGGMLTRCLLCGRYHDASRTHCSRCNGLLFHVSKKQPGFCLACCNGTRLSPYLEPREDDDRHTFKVLVRPLLKTALPVEAQALYFALEPDFMADLDDECYLLRPPHGDADTVKIIWPSGEEDMQELELGKPRLYWQNVYHVIHALLINTKTKRTDRLLSFIDNREKASGIRFRLRDEIADQVLTIWATAQWAGADALELVTAYERLEGQIRDLPNDSGILREIIDEVPFWFSRMLTQVDEYDFWRIDLQDKIAEKLDEDALFLIRQVFLPASAIDRAFLKVDDMGHLQHFFLEKYRVTTEYGLGVSSSHEQGYTITSLGEQGRNYRDEIKQLGKRLEPLLCSLCEAGILRRKDTNKGVPFYQLNSEKLSLFIASPQPMEPISEELPLVLVECHTADNTNEERTIIEAGFKEGKIQALICTPTLELGINIGDLTCVAMIGFPPGPANYAQRAGRAGRKSENRSATLVVLASPGDNHDGYYAANALKMIDGTITPPRFTLANKQLLAAHSLAYLLAGENIHRIYERAWFSHRVDSFFRNDELKLRGEISSDEYNVLTIFLQEKIRILPALLRGNHERGYKYNIFPDYGFRSDGIRLLNPASQEAEREDQDLGFLTAREPEEVVRKLVPGRIVACGGRPVRVAQEQPAEGYEEMFDPTGSAFRSYISLLAEKQDELYIYAKRDTDNLYQITRSLLLKQSPQQLRMQGPGYCHIRFISQGHLYFINEGRYLTSQGGEEQQDTAILQDDRGNYRLGTTLERPGLLISLAEQILDPDTSANFLAVLLRGIPDYFDLDDGELRVVQQIKLFSEGREIFLDTQEHKYLFLYGHDQSNLVPFEKIFEKLNDMLEKQLTILENCTCQDGCYHCLFSFGSRYLTGRISRQQAALFLRAYLRLSLLQPHISYHFANTQKFDILLKIELGSNRCHVSVSDLRTGADHSYSSDEVATNQNTRIYKTLNRALIAEAAHGARSVKIIAGPDYLVGQLQGRMKVSQGQEEHFRTMLTLLSWDHWTVE